MLLFGDLRKVLGDSLCARWEIILSKREALTAVPAPVTS